MPPFKSLSRSKRNNSSRRLYTDNQWNSLPPAKRLSVINQYIHQEENFPPSSYFSLRGGNNLNTHANIPSRRRRRSKRRKTKKRRKRNTTKRRYPTRSIKTTKTKNVKQLEKKGKRKALKKIAAITALLLGTAYIDYKYRNRRRVVGADGFSFNISNMNPPVRVRFRPNADNNNPRVRTHDERLFHGEPRWDEPPPPYNEAIANPPPHETHLPLYRANAANTVSERQRVLIQQILGRLRLRM